MPEKEDGAPDNGVALSMGMSMPRSVCADDRSTYQVAVRRLFLNGVVPVLEWEWELELVRERGVRRPKVDEARGDDDGGVSVKKTVK